MYHIHTHTYIYFYTYDIGFVFGYRKTNKQEKDRNPREKWAEDLHMQYIKESIKRTIKVTCNLISSVLKGMQIEPHNGTH